MQAIITIVVAIAAFLLGAGTIYVVNAWDRGAREIQCTRLNGYQAKVLAQFVGNRSSIKVSVGRIDRPCVTDEGEVLPAGMYVWEENITHMMPDSFDRQYLPWDEADAEAYFEYAEAFGRKQHYRDTQERPSGTQYKQYVPGENVHPFVKHY